MSLMTFISSLIIPITAYGASITCTVSPLNTSFIAKTLGETTVDGRLHVARPIDSLRLNKNNPIKFIGKKSSPSGVRCNVWEGCIYSARSNLTQHITWYFSDPGVWETAMGSGRVAPVLITVAGSMKDFHTQAMRTFDHRYVFADFRPYLTQGTTDSFQIPKGAICKNEFNQRDLPKIPSHFRFRTEILNGVSKFVQWDKEYYDADLKLSRYDYKEPYQSKYGNKRLVRIHDFNIGIAYTIDPGLGNCSITKIEEFGYDDKSVDGQQVRLRTPLEFFHQDKSNFVYVGQRTERGIVCDVWTGSRTDFPPPGPTFPTVWEYYFTARTEVAIGTQDEFHIPIKLRITSSSPTVIKEQNFYEFNTANTVFHDYNVAQCFEATRRADFLLVVPGYHRDLVFKNIVVFKRLVVLSVNSEAVVSPIRVSNVQVDFNTTGLLVTFTLLDAPVVAGNVKDPSHEPNLDGATANLKQALDTNSFSIYLSDPTYGDGLRALTPRSYTYSRATGSNLPGSRLKRDTMSRHVTRVNFSLKSATGISGGALAGVAVGVALGGFILGFIIFFFVFKSRQPGTATSFSNPMKEVS